MVVLAWSVGLPGCATLVTDDHQSMIVTSDPPGATCDVRQGGASVAQIGQTPATIMIGKSRHDIGIDCVRAGYYPGAAVVEPHFQGMTLGNAIYGGLIGLLVDTSSGAINEYPRWVAVLMERRAKQGESLEETQRLAQIQAARRAALRAGTD